MSEALNKENLNEENPSHSAPRFVGLDVHKRQITWCIIDAAGKTLRTGELAMTAVSLDVFAEQRLRPTDQVALESTTNCWAVVAILKKYVQRVVVSNPMTTRAIAHSKIKTDKVDSHVLAQLLRCDFLPEVWQPDEATQLRRQVTGRRASLVGQRVQLQNRIHSVLAMRLIVPPGDVGLFSKTGRTWLDTLDEKSIDADGLAMIHSDLRMLESIQKEIEVFDQRLAELAWQDERVKLLMTMPGVSIVVAQGLVAAFGDIERFASADKAASYLGLVPSTRQSANSVHHGPITKRGNANARWMLVQSAQHMARQPGPLGHFFRRIKKRKCHNVAVVATARKMAMIAWHMLKSNEPYRYSPPRSTETKLAGLRVAATGKRRKGGSGKGIKPTAKLPGGSKTIKPLDVIYWQEGLPGRKPLKAGELKHLAATGTMEFVEQIGQQEIIPRRKTAQAANAPDLQNPPKKPAPK
jgi:transposase